MPKYYVLINPISYNGRENECIKRLSSFRFDGDLIFFDIRSISNYSKIIEALDPEDSVIICGGDGTLNRLINDMDSMELKNKILYYIILCLRKW